ncbi:MAG: signal peptidase I [Candidatus Saccharibacteria bacterium]|nr:signal peptidase I [Candidatus Saccharibacteria bacterium]
MLFKRAKQIMAGLAIISIASLSLAAVVTKARHGALLSVQTGSMVPVLNKGDLVNVTKVSAGDLHPGDVITFINPANSKQTITHRIVEVPTLDNGQKFVTRGDANPVNDQPIEAKSIIGKVGGSVPKVGYAVDVVRKPLGLALIIYVPALFVIIGELKSLAAYYKSQETYMLPWRRKKGSALPVAKLLPLAIIVPLAIFVPVKAAMQTTATITANTITATRPAQPNTCNTGGNNTSITVTGSGNINISNSNNQTAQTGNSTSTSGNATSGNATNCNSTNINVNVSN